MANRVSPSDVDAIMEEDISALNINAYITAANILVTDKLSGAGVSDAMLKEIERWLSAHFVAVGHKDNRIFQEKIDVASVTYMTSGEGDGALDMTPYGKQVKLLDTTGSFNSTKTLVFETYGATHEDVTDLNA